MKKGDGGGGGRSDARELHRQFRLFAGRRKGSRILDTFDETRLSMLIMTSGEFINWAQAVGAMPPIKTQQAKDIWASAMKPSGSAQDKVLAPRNSGMVYSGFVHAVAMLLEATHSTLTSPKHLPQPLSGGERGNHTSRLGRRPAGAGARLPPMSRLPPPSFVRIAPEISILLCLCPHCGQAAHRGRLRPSREKRAQAQRDAGLLQPPEH